MKLQLEFEMDNPAFSEDENEAARILRHVAMDFEAGKTAGPCIDANGNQVGMWTIISEGISHDSS